MLGDRKIPWYLFLGFAISSVGPLALVTAYLPAGAGNAYSYYAIESMVGVALFSFPVLVWYRYSKKVASAGGLYAFTKAAAGGRLANLQGAIWSISYFLYLPFTVAYINYFLAKPIFGLTLLCLAIAELLLPLAISMLMLSNRKNSLYLLLALAIVQIAIILALGGVALSKPSAAAAASSTQTLSLPAFLNNSGTIGLFLICLDLPLFLGGEVSGGTRSVRKILICSFLLVSVLTVFSAYSLSVGLQGIGANATEGLQAVLSLITSYAGGAATNSVAFFVLFSIAGVIIAEFFALSRLMHSALNWKVNKTVKYISSAFIALSAVSLLNPYDFYNYLLPVSLVALYASQFIVFAVYPLFARKYSELTAVDLLLALLASALMFYGLYGEFSGLAANVYT